MSRYKREDYEDLDEYEDEDQEEEEVVGEDEYEDEEEAPPQPTQQELEYLELRKHLKDSIRKQMKKENGSSLGHSQEKKKKLPYDNYGSFFGPSQPVIAPRVIQESMSLLETERLTAKIPKPNQSNNIASTSSGGGGYRNRVPDSRLKKRPARPYSDDEDDIGGGSGITSMIQRLMGYKGHDSDDSDMEANFDDILKEEQRSERIARMEDEEELRRIEEEEKREMLRKEAKKRKLSHR